jgi:hypothetical protein
MAQGLIGLKLVVLWALFLFSFLSSNTFAQTTMPQIVNIPIPGSPLSLNIMANPQPLQNINTNPAASAYQLYDDGWANVPLEFQFPFYGQNFDNSTMYSNGAVQFGPPVQGFPSNNTFCCSGITIDRNTPAAYNYSILMLQTDLYGASGANHYSLGDTNSMTYGWYGVERLGQPQNKFDFELKVDKAGGIDMRWGGALLSYETPTIGTIGNAANGEFAVIQQPSWNSGFQISGLTQITTGQTLDLVIDQCKINPLSSPTCTGYQEAYLIQQCSIDSLYSTSCPGYQSAYTTQQCNANPLYSTSCSGYAAAYYSQQCSANPLYDINCPGYATAYLDLQCSIDPLYSTTCVGYSAAYQDQQCSINALYSTSCSGYEVAYKTQQCTANALYATDCPGYAEAYLNDQCIKDSLYSNQCEGYSTAYAIKYLVVGIDSTVVNNSLSETASTKASDPTNNIVATNTASTTVSSDGTVSTGVSSTGDTNVDKVIAVKTSSANNTTPGAAVQLTAPAPAAAVAQRQEPKQEKQDNKPSEDKKAGDDRPSGDKKSGDDKPSGGPTQMAQNDSGSSGEKPKPTARQEIKAKREAAAKAKAVEDGKNLAGNMGKAADMEQQKQIQNVVIQAMGFTPGFDAYGKQMIVQTQFYKPYSVYGGQKNIDNRANLRMFGGTDRLHNEMVEAQYAR